MLTTAICLFALAAMGGATLATCHLTKRKVPWSIVVLHGLLAFSGLLTLILAASRLGTVGWLHGIVGMFLLAGGGGTFILYRHLRYKPIPAILIVGHGLFALASFVLLLLYKFQILPSI